MFPNLPIDIETKVNDFNNLVSKDFITKEIALQKIQDFLDFYNSKDKEELPFNLFDFIERLEAEEIEDEELNIEENKNLSLEEFKANLKTYFLKSLNQNKANLNSYKPIIYSKFSENFDGENTAFMIIGFYTYQNILDSIEILNNENRHYWYKHLNKPDFFIQVFTGYDSREGTQGYYHRNFNIVVPKLCLNWDWKNI